MVSIIWKRRKYNLDCREVARSTQNACVPIIIVPIMHGYDIAKAV